MLYMKKNNKVDRKNSKKKKKKNVHTNNTYMSNIVKENQSNLFQSNNNEQIR